MELKLIHTADWHLGKVLNGHSFLEDQQYVLKQLIEVLERATGCTHYCRRHL